MTSDAMDNAFLVCHWTLFVVGVSGNVTLLLAAFINTPVALKPYSVMIKVGTMNDLIAVCIDIFTMLRLVVFPDNVVYLATGPCSLISPHVCYTAYVAQSCSETFSVYVITASFAFRLYILHRQSPKSSSVFLAMLALFLLPVGFAVAFLMAEADQVFLRNYLAIRAPSYLLEHGALIGHPGMTPIVIFIYAFGVVCTPGPAYATSIYIRRKILIILKQHRNMSERTRKMHKSLTKALTAHAMIQPITIIAVIFFVLMRLDIYRHPAMEMGIYIFVTLTSTLAPFCTLYYVDPYRNFILRRFPKISSPEHISNSAVLGPTKLR